MWRFDKKRDNSIRCKNERTVQSDKKRWRVYEETLNGLVDTFLYIVFHNNLFLFFQFLIIYIIELQLMKY